MQELFAQATRDAWWGFLTAAVLAWLTVPLVKRLAIRIGAVVAPAERRVHTRTTPLLGGVAMLLAIVIATIVWVPWRWTFGLALLNERQLAVTLICAAAVCVLGGGRTDDRSS
jgi:UDP-N-acetylmuramyl pentapeptide phosphotransferase/UDP-N-acetylglucosamine-1-phosphate transferase